MTLAVSKDKIIVDGFHYRNSLVRANVAEVAVIKGLLSFGNEDGFNCDKKKPMQG